MPGPNTPRAPRGGGATRSPPAAPRGVLTRRGGRGQVAAARAAKRERFVQLPAHLSLASGAGSVLWVGSHAALAEAAQLIAAAARAAAAHPPAAWGAAPGGVVAAGLDVEWQPVWAKGAPERPASILQVATEERVMVFDLIWAGAHAEVQLDAALCALFRCEALLKIGFDFVRNDLRKLAASYPRVAAFRACSPLLDLAEWSQRSAPAPAPRPHMFLVEKTDTPPRTLSGCSGSRGTRCGRWRSGASGAR